MCDVHFEPSAVGGGKGSGAGAACCGCTVNALVPCTDMYQRGLLVAACTQCIDAGRRMGRHVGPRQQLQVRVATSMRGGAAVMVGCATPSV
jgi:hypothetical protein